LEIANEMIPNIMKAASGEQAASDDPLLVVSSFASDVPLVSDPECYAFILQFYDGLCLWEEGSSTPVLHITWATHALYSLNRFDTHARTHLLLKEDRVADGSRIREDSTPSGARSTKSKRAQDDVAVKQRGRSLKQSSPTDVESDTEATQRIADDGQGHVAGVSDRTVDEAADETEKLSIALRSAKMIGMKDLLVAERLNSGAIKLQLTAQSQLQFKQSRTAEVSSAENLIATDGTRKRTRRE
jgi:menin